MSSEVKRRNNKGSAAAKNGATVASNNISNPSTSTTAPSKTAPVVDTATLEQIEATSDGMVDLETAAMLITDLHHKAAAAAADASNHHHHNHAHNLHHHHHGHNDDPSTPYSPDHTTMFDSNVQYISNGSMSLPQMPWDSFMSHSVRQPKAFSISSSISGSQGSQLSQLSYNSASTLQPNQNMPSIERFNSNGDNLNPALQHINDASLPVSGSATPNGGRGLSPFPFLIGPISPVDYRRSPGPSQALTSPKAPQIESNQEYEAILDNIKNYDSGNALQANFQLQSRKELNEFLATYFNLFHHHLPFLHPESFKPSTAASPLLLAIMSIGALYTFNQEQAFLLHIGSKQLVNQFLQGKESFSSRKCPLWAMQSTLINMIFSSWSGDPKGLEWAVSVKSLLANVSVLFCLHVQKADILQMVTGNRYELKLRTEAREGRQPTHTEWTEDEGCRRTYYSVYIFYGLLTLSYNHTPAISFNEFEDLELPSSESLWNLEQSDEESWRESLSASMIITVREAHDSLFQGEAARYSAFATRVMINALFLQVWNHKRSFEALQDVVTEYKLRLALETWEKSLELCYPETIVVQLSTPQKGHPLIFNAMAVYRNTRARLEVDLKNVQEALRYHDPYEVAAAMASSRDNVKRSPEMIKVIEECFECIETVAIQGIRILSRTCATNWSVEHPLCGLDLMVILSLWLYRLEHDEEPATEEEITMYNKIRNLFDDDSVDVFGSKLSSTVARLWGSMLDEVVVWG